MGITRSVNTANDPKLGPVFSFKTYERSQAPFYNNNRQIDFVTWSGNLYVCVEDNVSFKAGNPADNGFLLLIKKGADGRPGAPGAPGKPGPMPEYSLKFDGKQLVVIDQNGVRKAVSPELTGPSWFPELQGHTIIWKRKGAEDTSIPQNIDLDELRPIEECPILLRLNSDNTKREAEKTGPGYYIQWKREGAEEWTNLMSISELMNIALAGVCFWWDDAKDGSTDIEGNPVQTLHFGHRQVVEATYDASKLGNKRIADVTLGDVLFDAGEIPFANYDADIATLNAYICDLQDDLETTKASIPTKLSQLINDVPYIKTINGHLPNTSGELKLKKVDNIDLVGEGNIPFATINGRPIVNTDANFEIPSDYLTEGQLKTVGGQSLIKTPGQTDILLRTINGESIIGSTPLSVGTVKSVSVNGGTHVTPDVNGNVDLSVSGGAGGDGTGIDGIKFRLTDNNTVLQYSITENGGTWQNWVTIPLPDYSGFTPIGENIALKIENNYLYLSHNGTSGPWDQIGAVNGNGGTGGDPLTYIKLRITPDNGTSKFEISYNNGSSWSQWGTLSVDGSIVLSSYYTKSEIDSMLAGVVPGINVPTYRPFILYKRTATTETPTKPGTSAWKWYPDIDNLLHSASDSSVSVIDGWENNIPNATAELPFLWHSINVFSNITGTSEGKEWSPAQRMTPVDGTDGNDGDSIKFIFKLTSGSNDIPTAPSATAPAFNGGWSDNASGIDIDNKAEFYCVSYCVNGVWGAWSGPYLWSLWGENGVDGNGVEYIYLNQGSSNVATNNDPSKLANSVLESAAYQTTDYVPKTGAQLISGTLGVDWTDEPTGVSSTYPYEFVCVRKYDGLTQTWGAFSEPKVWAHFGQDGVGLVNNYIIVPTSTNVAKVEVANSNPTSYTVNGTVTWELYDNGTKVTNGYCQAYLGSYTSGTQLTVSNSNGTYSASVSESWDGAGFIQLLWYEGGNAQGKILDSAIIPVIIPGEKGDAGSSTVQALDGPVMRVRTWSNGTQYYAENDPQDGISYIDVVYYNDNYYKCISSTNSVNPTNTTYWTPYSFLGDAAFETLLARSAYIQNLTSKQVVITDSNDQIEAGMASSQSVNNESALNGVTVGSVRIWAGPISNGNLSTAPFTVTDTGAFNATAGQIGGPNGISFGSDYVTLGNNVVITYSDLHQDLKDAIDNAGGLTQAEWDEFFSDSTAKNSIIEGVVNTTIGNDYVATNDLFVNGKIKASLIDAGSITTDKINLSGSSISSWNDIVSCDGGLNIYIGDPDDAPNDSLVFNY